MRDQEGVGEGRRERRKYIYHNRSEGVRSVKVCAKKLIQFVPLVILINILFFKRGHFIYYSHKRKMYCENK